MAYSKVPLLCGDRALGYQDVNQVMDNADALRDLYDVRHGLAEPAPGAVDPSPWIRVGRHDDLHVARTVARVRLTTVSGFITWATDVTGGGITRLDRVGVGQFEIGLSSGAGQIRATVQVEAASTTPVRHHTVYVYLNTVYVTTYELAAGAFSPTDMDFDLFVWGTGA